MKLVDVKSKTYIDFGIANNDKCPTFKIDDHLRMSNYKKILAKCYDQCFESLSEEIFVIDKVKECLGRL